jgi:hypothetical protein
MHKTIDNYTNKESEVTTSLSAQIVQAGIILAVTAGMVYNAYIMNKQSDPQPKTIHERPLYDAKFHAEPAWRNYQ